ncbi:hypothetical protein AAK899_07345 [Erysipelotrichaceae bacterium 51-3]
MDRKPDPGQASSSKRPLKKLYILSGAATVKKTGVCEQLKTTLANSVYLDGKWCWNAHPMVDTVETRYMVLQNICFLLNQFLVCSAYDNIVFGWEFDQTHTIESILGSLDKQDCTIRLIHLEENKQVLASPAASRQEDKGQSAFPFNGFSDPDILQVISLDVATMDVSQIVQQILQTPDPA